MLEDLSRRTISPIALRDCLEWQDVLHSRSDAVDRVGVGYGHGGSFLYYFLLEKACPNTKSRSYIAETTEIIFDKISAGHFNYPDLVEFYFILKAFSGNLPKNLDPTDLIQDVNVLLCSLTERMVEKQMLQPYIGAFNFGYISMVLNDNDRLVRRLVNFLVEQIADHEDLEGMFVSLIPERQLNITHGVAFYLFFFSVALKKAIISRDRISFLKKLTALLMAQIYSDERSFRERWDADTPCLSASISYGTLGLLSAIISSNHCLNEKSVENKIKRVLSQIDFSVGSDGFGLLNGYSGMFAFVEANRRYCAPEAVEKIHEGYQADLKLAKQAIYAQSALQDNFYYGVTGVLSAFLPKSIAVKNRINHLLFLK